MKLTFSDKINILTEYLKSIGFEVILFSDKLPHDISGRIFYVNGQIHIGNLGSAEDAFYTLLHESGHAVSYNKYFVRLAENQPSVEKREIYAYLYGWYLNKHLKLNVSKKTWRLENNEIYHTKNTTQ